MKHIPFIGMTVMLVALVAETFLVQQANHRVIRMAAADVELVAADARLKHAAEDLRRSDAHLKESDDKLRASVQRLEVACGLQAAR